MAGLISEEDINQVRDRNDIIAVVSDHVTLKKKGRLLWGLCPFHNEKTPSFKVDAATQLWHCFGCGEGGNVFTFIMKVEHVDFPEAVETLADRVGFEVKREESAGPSRSFRQRLIDANEEAARYYALYLRRNPHAAEAREYLKGRGFHLDAATKFEIGYAPPGRDELVKHLAEAKFSGEEMIGAGLALRTDRGLRDRFFDRVMFPIRDIKDRVVAFGGRAMGGGTPKYLNSPETPVYHKSSTLYALGLAKSVIIEKKSALVVEGYTDVIALHAAGFGNAVATCGTALTAEHIKLLGRFTNRVVLVFDADAAGMAAAERGAGFVSEFRMPSEKRLAELSSKEQVDLFVAVLPEGQDPAEMVASGGPDVFETVLASATDLMEFAIDRRISRFDLSSSKGRIGAAQDTLALLAPMASPVAREEYMRVIADKVGVSTESLALELGRIRPSRGAGSEREPETAPAPSDVQTKAEAEMLKLAVSSPDMMKRAAHEIEPALLTVSANRELFDALIQAVRGTEEVDVSNLVGRLGPELQGLASGLLLDSDGVEEQHTYFGEILARLKEFEVGRQIDRLKVRIEKMNRLGDEQLYDSLFAELIALEARRRELKREGSGGATSADQNQRA